MADSLKLLVTTSTDRTPAAATNTLLYTVPASTSAMLTRILICNTSTVPTAFRIAIAQSAEVGTPLIDNWIAYDVPIGGNETINFALGVGLATGDEIWVYNILATLTFTPCGIEVTA